MQLERYGVDFGLGQIVTVKVLALDTRHNFGTSRPKLVLLRRAVTTEVGDD